MRPKNKSQPILSFPCSRISRFLLQSGRKKTANLAAPVFNSTFTYDDIFILCQW